MERIGCLISELSRIVGRCAFVPAGAIRGSCFEVGSRYLGSVTRGEGRQPDSRVQSAVCVRTEQASAHSPDILNGRAAGLCVNFAACRSAGLAARSCARRGTAVLQLSLASPPVVFSP